MIYVVSGPSGGGKSTLIRWVLESLPGLRFSVSHTTRQKRESEVEGRDYHFTSEPVFRKMLGRGEFLEWAVVHGKAYGTSVREIRKAAGMRARSSSPMHMTSSIWPFGRRI